MKLAIVGAGGMLGQALAKAAGETAVAFSRADLDVTNKAAVQKALTSAETVINCAAWTDVDGAEQHPDEAMQVNRDGARNVAEAAERVLYVSSDYVFDGRKGAPYTPEDQPSPLSSYGHSKLEGERATVEANERHFVVRSSWLFGAGGGNFVDTMLRLGRERDELRVVDDQVGCPTWTGHLGPALLGLAKTDDYGIHHLAAAGSCSWYELAREALAAAGVQTEITPCTTAEFPRPAPRPANSVLATDGKRALPHWREGVREYVGALG